MRSDPAAATPPRVRRLTDPCLPEGTVLADRYGLQGLLGQGGFGITYLAADRSLGSLVAIKEFFPRSAAIRASATDGPTVRPLDPALFQSGLTRFVQEARLLAELRTNPRIVSIYDVFQANGTAYIVMEYLRGRTLADIQAEHPDHRIPFSQLRVAMTEVLLALEALHGRGLLHQDLTPDNIFLSEAQHVRLIDFGAVRSFAADANGDGPSLGKHGYAGIEQYRADATGIGPWSDLYSLGATLYRLVTGVRPPKATDRLGPVDPLMPVSAFPISLPRAVADAIMRALAVEPTDRFPSAEAMRQALAAAPACVTLPETVPASGTEALSLCLGQDALKQAARRGTRDEIPDADALPGALDAWIGQAPGLDADPADSFGQTEPGGALTVLPVNEIIATLKAHELYLRGRRGGRRLMLKMVQFSGVGLAGKSFTRGDLVGCSFVGCTLTGADFREANLFCSDFRYADLRGADFRQADLRGAKFDHANLSGAKFDRADCREGTLMLQRSPGELLDTRAAQDQIAASFREARLTGASFVETGLALADLSGAEVRRANFDQADLTGADFSGSLIETCRFEGATVTGAKLYAAQMAEADRQALESAGARSYRPASELDDDLPTLLQKHASWSASLAGDGRQLHLVGLDLAGWQADHQDLSVAVFDSCNLARASLRGATLAMARFSGCNLEGAQLSEADARGVQMLSCNLRNADLTSTNLASVRPVANQDTVWRSVFNGSDLTGAKLENSRREQADFSHAHGCPP